MDRITEPLIVAEPLIEEGILSSIVGIMGVAITVGIADTVIPKTINYEVERLEWLAPQPLAPGQTFDFELKLRNRGSKNSFAVVLYVDGVETGHVYSGVVDRNSEFSCVGSMTMPQNTGVHYVSAEVTVGAEKKIYPVSTVYVARYSIEQLHWKRGNPPGHHTPPYINIGEPVGALRPNVSYIINYRIRNNDNVSRYYKVIAFRLGGRHSAHAGTVEPGELSKNISISFKPDNVGTYPIELRVLADDVNELHPNDIHLTDAIVTLPHTDFLISAATWDDDVPFDLHTLRAYEFEIENLGSVGANFSVDVYLDHKMHSDFGVEPVGSHTGTVQAGGKTLFQGNLITPTYYGRTYLLAKVVVDNIFEEWYVISHVDTGKRVSIDGLGDLNDDGYVTWADVEIVTRYILGYSIDEISLLPEDEFLRRADMNYDGVINVLDMVRIMKFVWDGIPLP